MPEELRLDQVQHQLRRDHRVDRAAAPVEHPAGPRRPRADGRRDHVALARCASFCARVPVGSSGCDGRELRAAASEPERGDERRAIAARRGLTTPPMLTYLISRKSSMPYFEPSRPEARLLHAAERRDLGRDQAGVDADDAVFQRLGHAPDPRRGRGRRSRRRGRTRCRWPARSRRPRPRSGRAAPPGRRSPRCATFIVAGDAGEDRRLEEAAAERVALAAERDLRALGDRVGDVLLDLLDRRRRRSAARRSTPASMPSPTFSARTFSASFSAKAS